MAKPFPVLFAPDSFVEAPDWQRKQVCNGCGPGGWKFDLVPDTIYGLDVSAACDIHDWMFTVGETNEDFDEANRVFKYNLLRIIYFYTDNRVVRWLRRRRALKYYYAVKEFGGPYFWKGKNPEKNEIMSTEAAVRGLA